MNRPMRIPVLYSKPNRAPKGKWRSIINYHFRFIPITLWRRDLFLLIAALSLITTCGETQNKKKPTYNLDKNPPAPAAGQAYYYQHSGPQPWSDGRQDASGGRLVVVLDPNTPNPSRWNVEEHFERADGVQSMQIDNKYHLHQVAIKSGETEIVIQYTPAIPLRFLDLKKDDKKVWQSHFVFMNPQNNEFMDGSGDYKTEVQRRYDLRIITPAGAYLCRQFIVHTTIETTMSDIKTTFQVAINSYWCDDIGWFVKEEYSFEPMLQNGQAVQPAYQAVSTLTQYKPMNPNSLHREDETNPILNPSQNQK